MATHSKSSIRQAAENRVERFQRRWRTEQPFPLIGSADVFNLCNLVETVLTASEDNLRGESGIPGAKGFAVNWDSAKMDADATDISIRAWTVDEYTKHRDSSPSSGAMPAVYISAAQWAARGQIGAPGYLADQSAMLFELRFKLQTNCRVSNTLLGSFQMAVPQYIEEVAVEPHPPETYLCIWMLSSNIWPANATRMTALFARERIGPVMLEEFRGYGAASNERTAGGGLFGFISSTMATLLNPPQRPFVLNGVPEDGDDADPSIATGTNHKKRKLDTS